MKDKVISDKHKSRNNKTLLQPLCPLCTLWCILFLICSCERRELVYSVDTALSISVDWSRADQEEEKNYGATVIFYPHDGGAPRTVLMGDRTQTTVNLPSGHYSVLLFNRSFYDFSGIAFRGAEDFHTLEAYARKVETRASSRVIVENPEKLATARMDDFENTSTLHLVPTPLTRKIEVQVYLKGLKNVKEVRCILDGIPTSVLLSTGMLSGETASHEFELGNPVYDSGSKTDGTMSGSLNVFGFNPDLPHEMKITALLADNKTVVNQTFEKVQVDETMDEKGIIILRIEATAPEAFPDVEMGGSGMDVDVGNWGDEENTDIEL